MSKYHSDNFSDGIKRVQRRKIADGIWPQQPPLGYQYDPQIRGIVPDPRRAPLVRRAFELYASGGYTLARLRAAINALGFTNRPHRDGSGGGPLSVSQYQNMLTNPIYYGVMRFNGELHQGKHLPLITKQLFDAAQEILACRSKPNAPGPIACMYRGTFRCGECGASITSEIQKRPRVSAMHKKTPSVFPAVRSNRGDQCSDRCQIHRFSVPDDLADWMVQQLHLEFKHHIRARAETVDHLRSKIKLIDQHLKRLLNLHVEQTISLEEYRSERTT